MTLRQGCARVLGDPGAHNLLNLGECARVRQDRQGLPTYRMRARKIQDLFFSLYNNKLLKPWRSWRRQYLCGCAVLQPWRNPGATLAQPWRTITMEVRHDAYTSTHPRVCPVCGVWRGGPDRRHGKRAAGSARHGHQDVYRGLGPRGTHAAPGGDPGVSGASVPPPGAGPHVARATTATCGAFLRWLPKALVKTLVLQSAQPSHSEEARAAEGVWDV
jgi:hypothetical protein